MKALGVDLGDARIGVAVSDELGSMALPLETINVRETKDTVARVADLVTTHRAAAVVLGLPRNMDGTYGPAAEKTRAFAEKLRATTSAQVHFWDERLTSVAAQRALHETGRNTKQSRAVIDQVAAQLILQGWLDAQAMQAGQQ